MIIELILCAIVMYLTHRIWCQGKVIHSVMKIHDENIIRMDKRIKDIVENIDNNTKIVNKNFKRYEELSTITNNNFKQVAESIKVTGEIINEHSDILESINSANKKVH